MQALKTVLAVFAVMLAVVGILACGVGIYYAWSLNTPVTESLVGALTSVERALTVVDGGIERVDGGLGTAQSAVNTIEGAVMAAGDTIVNTDIAFTILERTVGDTLFPRLIEAGETTRAMAATVVAVNDTLEAANELPFIDLPTLTDELQTAADRLTAAQQRLEEIRTEMRAIKEEAVSRPVAAITSRTTPLLENLDAAQAAVQSAQANLQQALQRAAATRARVPGTIDTISLVATLAFVWLIIAQASLAYQSWRFLRTGH